MARIEPLRRTAALLVNPVSGKARAGGTARRFREALAAVGVEGRLFPLSGPGEGRRLAAEAAGVCDVLVAIGGDGTVNEAANGLAEAGAPVPLAHVPAGTANVIAEELGLPDDLAALAEVVAAGPVRRIDSGLANGRRFLMCAGAGFDAAIVDRVHRARTAKGIGFLDYYAPTVGALARYGYPPMRVTVDGEEAETAATFVVIGNMRRYGGPFRFFRRAVPDDGRLDVCCLTGRGALCFLAYGWHAFRDTLPRRGDVRYFAGKEIVVESAEPVLVQVDGDPGGALPLRVEIDPASIPFCVAALDPHGEGAACDRDRSESTR